MQFRTAKDRNNRLGSYVKADNPIPECLKDRGYSDIYLYLMGWDEDPAFVCEQNGKKGLVDGAGNYILPCEQDEIYENLSMETLIPFRRNGLWALVQNGTCTDAVFQDVDLEYGEYCRVRLDGKWGWVDKQGVFTLDEDKASFYAGNGVIAEEDMYVLDGEEDFNRDAEIFSQSQEWKDSFIRIMKDNDLNDNNKLYRLYWKYHTESKGCNMDDPIVITSVDSNYVSMERAILDFIFQFCRDGHRFEKQALIHKEDRWLDCMTYAILDKNGTECCTVSYWFDVTLGIQSIREELNLL